MEKVVIFLTSFTKLYLYISMNLLKISTKTQRGKLCAFVSL